MHLIYMHIFKYYFIYIVLRKCDMMKMWYDNKGTLKWSIKKTCFISETGLWQGQQESNPQPTVLETATLPIELYPFDAFLVYNSFSLMSMVFLNFCVIFALVCGKIEKDKLTWVSEGGEQWVIELVL